MSNGELHAGCRADVCDLAKRTGIFCPDDECDLRSGVRTLTPQQYRRAWLGEPSNPSCACGKLMLWSLQDECWHCDTCGNTARNE